MNVYHQQQWYLNEFTLGNSLLGGVNASRISVGNSTAAPLIVDGLEELLGNLYFNIFFMAGLAALISIALALFIECAGSVVGGIFGSIPTAIVPSTLGFAFSTMVSSTAHESIDMQQRIMVRSFFTIPIGNFMTIFFLLCWKFFPKPIDRFIISRYRNFIERKIKRLTDQDQLLRHATLEMSNCSINLQQNEYYVKENQDIVYNKKIQNRLRNLKFKLLLWKFLGSYGFIRLMSGLIIMCLALIVLFTMSGIFLGVSELTHWPDEVTIVLGSICFVGKVLIAVVVNWRCNKFKSKPKSSEPKLPLKKRICNFKISPSKIVTFLLKIVIPFSVVALSVYLKKQSLTTVAGLLASFPAIYATTLFTLWISSDDENLAVDSTGPMMLGSSSVSLYALVACPIMMYWNILGGAALAYVTAVSCVNIPAFFYLKWRSKVMERREQEELLKQKALDSIIDPSNETKVDYSMVI